MSWRVHFFLQEKYESDILRKGFRFKSKSAPPQYQHMETFEKGFIEMIPNIKFRSVKDTFQKKLKEEIEK